MGYLFYRGVLKINLAKFFRWTGVILIVVAAGVLSYGVHDLQEAGILPGLNNLAFDVSDQVPESSWYGTLLKGTVNFSPDTTWLQAVVWVLYLVPTMTVFLLRTRRPAPTAPTAPAAFAGARPLRHRKARPREPSARRRSLCCRPRWSPLSACSLHPVQQAGRRRAARAPST